jgi:hypothetical protein
LGWTVRATVRLLPAGSETIAVSRSESLPLRTSSRRSGLGSGSLTVLRPFAPTLKDLALSLTTCRRDTVTLPPSRRRGR